MGQPLLIAEKNGAKIMLEKAKDILEVDSKVGEILGSTDNLWLNRLKDELIKKLI